jgi:hypothetical protein
MANLDHKIRAELPITSLRREPLSNGVGRPFSNEEGLGLGSEASVKQTIVVPADNVFRDFSLSIHRLFAFYGSLRHRLPAASDTEVSFGNRTASRLGDFYVQAAGMMCFQMCSYRRMDGMSHGGRQEPIGEGI